MNIKRTNRFVAILNVISVASIYILYFSTNYLLSSIMSGDNGGKSVYNSFILDTLLNNIQIIMAVFYSGVGIINVICAIQNKDNKKIFFWQLVFGLYEIWAAISLGVFLKNADILEIGSKIVSAIPIILVIINFIRIKKNRPKVIQIISYIAVLIISILDLLDIVGAYWNVIAIVMQFIYIHFQDKNIEENGSRKIINIILYYVIQVIIVIGFLFMIIYSLLISKINEVRWKNGLEELYNNVATLQGSTNKELYIPVEKNYKFGFINESGKEKIACEYDRVTYFNEIEINSGKYYIALAKKDDKYYIISKNNNSIELNGNLEKYMQTIDNYWGEIMTNMFNEDENYRIAYLQSFEFFLQVLTREEAQLSQQTVEKSNYGTEDEVSLTKRNSKFTYKSSNYTMLIEPIREKVDEDDYFENYLEYSDKVYYNEDDDTYYISSDKTKCKVTITKSNGEEQSSIVYLPGIDEDESSLETFTNGFIEFKSEDEERVGWYDSNGNQATIPSNYEIQDIKDNKIILRVDNFDDDEEYDENKHYEMNFIIIDMFGNTLLQTTALDIYDNMYLVKNNNKKMVLLDKDLKQISNEYDKIITTIQMEIFANYSSYY